MKKEILVVACILFTTSIFAQQALDKIYLGEEIRMVVIEEVGINTIKYRHKDEATSYIISKHQVDKIEFSSGREEVFESPFKPVKSIEESEKVYISYIPQDVEGLKAMGDVYSKATGVTAIASINNVKNRAVRKIKIEAAMLGANVILIGDTFQRGNQYGNENIPANATMTTLSGTAYSTEKADFTSLKEKFENNRFQYFQSAKLNRNAWDVNLQYPETHNAKGELILVDFENMVIRDGGLYVQTKGIRTKGNELKVVNSNEEMVVLMERDGKTIYNYTLFSEKDPKVAMAIKIANLK